MHSAGEDGDTSTQANIKFSAPLRCRPELHFPRGNPARLAQFSGSPRSAKRNPPVELLPYLDFFPIRMVCANEAPFSTGHAIQFFARKKISNPE
jgi:hypothetical protein